MSEVKLCHGDCLIEMDKIADESVDLVLTDPPYFVIPNGKPNDKFCWDSFESEKDFENFHLYVDFCFERDKQKEIQKIRKSSKTKEDYNKEKQILFDKYLADHNSKFADEFNVRMEKYNIELIQIKV